MRDLEKHISEALQMYRIGERIPILDIALFRSTECGEDHPTPGALRSRIVRMNHVGIVKTSGGVFVTRKYFMPGDRVRYDDATGVVEESSVEGCTVRYDNGKKVYESVGDLVPEVEWDMELD